MTNEHSLKVGWIPYLNFRPLGQELRLSRDASLDIKSGHPSGINRLLAERQIDIAPCSSVCMAFIPEHEMAVPCGMASRGKVMSVYLGLKHEHQYLYEFIQERTLLLKLLWQSSFHEEDIRKSMEQIWSKVLALPPAMILSPQMKLSSHSASSSVLARLFYIMWFGHQNYVEAQGHGRISEKPFGTDQPIELLIGDEALERRSQFSFVIDLGQAWWDITKLPFVFAVWQSRSPLAPALRSKILKASELAEMRMKLEPTVYFPEIMPLDAAGRQLPLADYWKLLDYRLGPEEIRGLIAFLYLAKQFRPVERSDQILLKIIRLQELCSRMASH